jgi:predicted enzyme related to lactoylglutathione lyase
MSDAVATITAVTIDANDAAAVAAFWAELTGTSVTDVVDEGRLHFLSAAEGAPELCIQRVPEPKTVKARVHLDLSAADLDAITQRILALGGSWSGEELTMDEYTWRSFQDPEGTEFDVLLA